MAEGPERQPLVERATGCEPAGPLAALDQSLLAQHLQRPADGHAANLVSSTQCRLAVEAAVVAKLAEGDPLLQVVGDLPESRMCHQLVYYK